jgi:hypothetical protein
MNELVAILMALRWLRNRGWLSKQQRTATDL